MEQLNSKSSKIRNWIYGTIGTIIIGVIIGYITNELPSISAMLKPDKKNKYITLIDNYYLDLKNRTLKTDQYFAPQVKRFFTMFDTNPEVIHNYLTSSYYQDYPNLETMLDHGTAKLTPRDDGTNSLVIEASFTCKRPSLNKLQIWRGQQEFIFDENSKIIEMSEILPYKSLRFEKLSD